MKYSSLTKLSKEVCYKCGKPAKNHDEMTYFKSHCWHEACLQKLNPTKLGRPLKT